MLLIMALAFTAIDSNAQTTLTPAEKRQRKERYAGLHFDFHAQQQDTLIGETFTYTMADSLLSITKPDFIQVDCKGHQGYSSYPTRVGNSPGKFSKDIMRIWRDVTAKYGIPLFVHYSGIWDHRALELHPLWGRMGSDSSFEKNCVSVLSPYVEELMMPQLKELATAYDLDGAWIDGDCWSLGHDYSPAVLTAFTEATGISAIPTERDAAFRFEFNEFNRKIFRDYVTKYVDAVHTVKPGFRITSNWSFSSIMPEKVDVPVDFLSGDVAGTSSVYSSAFESRCIALQGKPWDLMAWAFVWHEDMKATKSVVQLEQEAAEVLAMGGGFQTYWQQNHDGSVQPYLFGKMAEIIRFTEERKKYCYQNSIVPQIGLLYSTYAWKRVPSGGLYSSHSMAPMKGILNALLNSQLPVEILMDHQLAGRLEKYSLLIIPEWETIDPAIQQQLLDYVAKGGKLIVIGAKAVARFEKPLGVSFAEPLRKNATFYMGLAHDVIHVKASFQPAGVLPGTDGIGIQLDADDGRFNGSYPLATVTTMGKGKIAGIYMNTGEGYGLQKNPFIENLLQAVIKKMQPHLVSVVKGSSNLHQVVSSKNGILYIHLINVSGPHDNPGVLVYDKIETLNNIEVNVDLRRAPKQVLLQPGNRKLRFTYAGGNVKIFVPEVKVHSIIEIEKAHQ